MEELRTRKGETIEKFERDFAETGCLSKFLIEIDDEIHISNQDNFDQSQKNPRDISIFDQRSVIAFSENEVSPKDYHETINYPLVQQKISQEKRKSRKLSGQIDASTSTAVA